MTDPQQRSGGPLAFAQRFFAMVPHGKRLGMEPIAVGADSVTTRLSYKPEMVGNPATGVVHGGVITTLVDQTSGAAVMATLARSESVATLDLRIDHLARATPQREIYAQAWCYKVTANIAFVRCVVYQDAIEAPIATSMSTFMRTFQEGPNVRESAV